LFAARILEPYFSNQREEKELRRGEMKGDKRITYKLANQLNSVKPLKYIQYPKTPT
jgi:hypothetical protein